MRVSAKLSAAVTSIAVVLTLTGCAGATGSTEVEDFATESGSEESTARVGPSESEKGTEGVVCDLIGSSLSVVTNAVQLSGTELSDQISRAMLLSSERRLEQASSAAGAGNVSTALSNLSDEVGTLGRSEGAVADADKSAYGDAISGVTVACSAVGSEIAFDGWIGG